MKNFKIILSLALISLLLASCSTVTIYQASNFTEYQKKQKTVAIVPFDITIDVKNLPKDLSVEDFNKLQKDESLFIQDYFYVILLKESQSRVFSVSFQDVRTTNDNLGKTNIHFDNISDIDKSTLAQACGADAIISGFIYRSNPITAGGKLKNRVDIKVSIHDNNGKLLWEYYDTKVASTNISTLYLVEQLVQKIAKKLPYGTMIKEIVVPAKKAEPKAKPVEPKK